MRVNQKPAFLGFDWHSSDLYMVRRRPPRIQNIALRVLGPLFPKFWVPELLDFIRLSDRDLGRWRIGIHGKNNCYFAVDAFGEKRHGFGIERSHQMPLARFLEIFRDRDRHPYA